MHSRVLLLLFSLLASLPMAARAVAQEPAATGDADDEARWRFERARVDFEAGRYREALENFEGAYELSGHAELLFNIGHCAARLGMDERALEAFEGYLRERPDAENSEEVEGRVRELRARIAADQVVTEPATTPPDESGGILSKWWFWTAIGAVVVGAVVIGIVVAASSGSGGPDPVQGDYGSVLEVLTWR